MGDTHISADLSAARAMQTRLGMPTTMPINDRIPNLHTSAGLRWLAPATVAIVLVVAMFLLMLLYPHLYSMDVR